VSREHGLGGAAHLHGLPGALQRPDLFRALRVLPDVDAVAGRVLGDPAERPVGLGGVEEGGDGSRGRRGRSLGEALGRVLGGGRGSRRRHLRLGRFGVAGG